MAFAATVTIGQKRALEPKLSASVLHARLQREPGVEAHYIKEKVMNRIKLGKSILSFVLVVGAILATAVDWNTTHLFNPAWHPHARFHDAMFIFSHDGVSLIALWLLWRQSKEPGLGLKVAALLSVVAWTPFFYIATLIPGTSPLATENMPVLRVAGMSFPPNVIIAGVLLLLTAVGYWLGREDSKDA